MDEKAEWTAECMSRAKGHWWAEGQIRLILDLPSSSAYFRSWHRLSDEKREYWQMALKYMTEPNRQTRRYKYMRRKTMSYKEINAIINCNNPSRHPSCNCRR